MYRYEKFSDKNEQNKVEYDERYARYDGFLKEIAAWKTEIAALNPIRGLDIDKKDLIVDGRPWSVTNVARQVEIFIQVALLHISKLPEDMRIPLILCDDFEHLDQSTRDELVPQIIENEFQAVFCEVDPRKNPNLQLLYSFPQKEIKLNG